MTNNLDNNLELRKALAEVDRLTAKIVHIESFIKKDIEETSEALRNEKKWIGHSANEGDDYLEKLTRDEIFNLELRLEFLEGLLHQIK
jgi:ABC-type phosphate transport system auxiliary subunit